MVEICYNHTILLISKKRAANASGSIFSHCDFLFFLIPFHIFMRSAVTLIIQAIAVGIGCPVAMESHAWSTTLIAVSIAIVNIDFIINRNNII